jgi:hypothetical protein
MLEIKKSGHKNLDKLPEYLHIKIQKSCEVRDLNLRSLHL